MLQRPRSYSSSPGPDSTPARRSRWPERTLENTEEARDRLDRAVLLVIGMEDKLDALKRGVGSMLAMREREGGQNTEVLVTRPSERKVIELKGVSETRKSTTLGDFE